MLLMDELKTKLKYAEIFYNSNEEISTFFPLNFDINIIKNYNCMCVGCGNDIPPANVRGHVKKKISNVYELNAVALCPSCDLYNLHDAVRLREDDGTLSKQFHLEGQGWVSQVFDSQKKGWLEKLLGY